MLDSASYVLIAVSSPARASVCRSAVGEAENTETVLVRNGDDALQEVGRRGAPVLLIIDLSLPRVDGFAVIRRLRRSSAQATRIIALAAHEALLAAARELAESLNIALVLPLDVDPVGLAGAVTAALEGVRAGRPPAGSGTTASRPRASQFVDETIHRAALEARRRAGLTISVAYVCIDGEERLTVQLATRDLSPPTGMGDLSAFAFLREVSVAVDPLVVPDVATHPVFAELFLTGARPARGLVAIPVLITDPTYRAAICVLDVHPLMLNAADLDGLVTYSREVGRNIDRTLAVEEGDRSDARATGPAEVSLEEVKALQHLAATDPLTGLANRRGGEKHIGNEISRAKRERRPLSCILIDIDRFKQVNDTYGHQAGDQVLRDISALLRRTVRAYDILIRWGGEEFLLVLPGAGLGVAQALAERVRCAIEMLDTHGIGTVTISAGVATFEDDYDFAATLRTADRRLYQAKTSGRNRIV